MAPELTVGTRIYRPVRLAPPGGMDQVVLETPAMEHFDDGTVMLRAVPDAALAPDWQVAPWDAPGGRVCVCDEPIPEDWTYFEVLFADVNFVAVSPVAGDLAELQEKYLLECRG
ncbi:MAG: hypothetical protein AB1491_09365 [Thermodesulfobacteriota bacterium]